MLLVYNAAVQYVNKRILILINKKCMKKLTIGFRYSNCILFNLMRTRKEQYKCHEAHNNIYILSTIFNRKLERINVVIHNLNKNCCIMSKWRME